MGTRDHPVQPRSPHPSEGRRQSSLESTRDGVGPPGARGRASHSKFLRGRGRNEGSWVQLEKEEEEEGYTRGLGGKCLEPKLYCTSCTWLWDLTCSSLEETAHSSPGVEEQTMKEGQPVQSGPGRSGIEGRLTHTHTMMRQTHQVP